MKRLTLGTLATPVRKRPARAAQDVLDQLRESPLYFRYLLNDHPVRVSSLAGQIGQTMGRAENWCEELRVIALLHDIGKAHANYRHIYQSGYLRYPEPMRRLSTQIHQEKSGEVLGRLYLGSFERIRSKIALVAGNHHVWYRTEHDRLPQENWIVAVADAWDVMTSRIEGEEKKERGYAPLRTTEQALAIIFQDTKRGQFQPQAVEALFSLVTSENGFRNPQIGTA